MDARVKPAHDESIIARMSISGLFRHAVRLRMSWLEHAMPPTNGRDLPFLYGGP
jgi:hypothetical protein